MTAKEIGAHDLRTNLKSILLDTMTGSVSYRLSYLGLKKKFKIIVDEDEQKLDKPSALYLLLQKKKAEGLLKKRVAGQALTNKQIREIAYEKYNARR
jgi:hypothetical protein